MKNQRCPFCGHDIQVVRTDSFSGMAVAWVECDNCHADGPPVFVPGNEASQDEAAKQAIAKWNLRIVGRSGE